MSDFAVLTRRWALEGRQHSGLILTSDASLPRGKNAIGLCVTELQALIRAHPAETAFTDRIHWP